MEDSSSLENPKSPSVSSSISRTQILKGSHRFEISGYSLVKGIGVGNYVASDTFKAGKHSWEIYFYPDGKESTTYVSCVIALVGECKDVRASFELKLLNQSDEGKHMVYSQFLNALEKVSESWTEVYSPYSGCRNVHTYKWGYIQNIDGTALENSDFLKDDRLCIQCTIGVVSTPVTTSKATTYSQSSPPSDIVQDLGKLLKSSEDSDVKFEVEGEIFAAHKWILAARSPVFKAQLFGAFKEHHTEWIRVEDMKAPVFKALLEYIYCDAFPNVEEFLGFNSRWAKTVMAQHLLSVADRYALQGLRFLCEARIEEHIAIDTVASSLALAEQHNCSQLKSVCIEFIARPENFKAVMQTEGYKHLKESCPSVLTELLECVASKS